MQSQFWNYVLGWVSANPWLVVGLILLGFVQILPWLLKAAWDLFSLGPLAPLSWWIDRQERKRQTEDAKSKPNSN